MRNAAGSVLRVAQSRQDSQDSRKAATILLEKAHVATIPGVVFGAQGEGHVRFGYSVPKTAIEAGIEALSKFLKG